MTPERLARIKKVVSQRQNDLTLVLENIHDPHNVSAILRSADAAGVGDVYLIYNTNKFPKIGKVSSASAKKWVDLHRFSTPEDCFRELRRRKFRIFSTFIGLSGKSCSLYDLNLKEKCAIVLGNEHDGVSPEVRSLSDSDFHIPMFGMVQSLNVSVAAAVCLFEAVRQRESEGMYENARIRKKELKTKLEDYLKR